VTVICDIIPACETIPGRPMPFFILNSGGKRTPNVIFGMEHRLLLPFYGTGGKVQKPSSAMGGKADAYTNWHEVLLNAVSKLVETCKGLECTSGTAVKFL
jgi:hypothetical protein